MRKGQVSTEITIVIGFVVLLMLPILLSVYMQLNDANNKLFLSQANTAATRLAYAIDSVGNLGTNASMVVELKMPGNVRSVTGNSRELVFDMYNGDPTGQFSTNQIVKLTRFNLITDPSILRMNKPGTYNVEVVSQEGTATVLMRLYEYN